MPILMKADYVNVNGVVYGCWRSSNPLYNYYAWVVKDSRHKKLSGNITIQETVSCNNRSYTVLGIGNYAFENCKDIVSVTIPSSLLKGIEKYAFKGCTGLKTVTYSQDVEVELIGEGAFLGCTSLTNIDLPITVKEIGDEVFYGCANLKSVIVPKGISAIKQNWFAGCSSLSYVKFLDENTSIPQSAFANLEKLEEVVLPESMESIPNSTFYGCHSLYTIHIPNSVTSIGDAAFYGCRSLPSLNILEKPNNLRFIGASAFSGCTNLASPICLMNIETIGNCAFENCKSLLSIIISGNTIYVGDSAFRGCEKLTTAILEGNIEAIRNYTFENCSSLPEIKIPDSVTDIGHGAFKECSNLSSIIIPNNVTSIGWSAFRDCSELREVTLGRGISRVEDGAFYGCEKIEEVTYYCSYIGWGSSWPQYNKSIKKVIIGEGVETIGEYAFSAGFGTSGLETIIFANPTLKKIGEKAFGECKSLKYAYNEGSVQPSEGTIILPEPLESIGLNAFWISPEIKKISLPSSLTFIDNLAFYGNNNEIGVEDVYAHMLEPFKINESVFHDNTYKNAILHTDGVADKYRDTFAWSKFFHIVNNDEAAGYGDGGSDSENHGNSGHASQLDEIIDFADPQVKTICVDKWDTSKDGNLSKREAAAVTSLGTAFKGTDITSFNELKHFTGLTKIDNWAFGNCTNLLFVILPEQVTEIGMNAFTNCTALTAMTIPALVATIGESAFAGCKSLMAFNVDTQNEKFATEGGILYNKEKTTLISCPAGKFATATLPESVLKIEANGFYNCVNLPAIILPASLQKIGAASFVGCSSLTSLDIPASTSKIEIGNFTGCTNLETINVEADNQYYQSIDGVLYTKDGKTLMAYPNKKGTTYIVLEGTETIEAYAFCMTEVENLTLPASVQNVDDYALGLCNKLSRLKVKAVTPSEASSSSFVGTLSSVMLILPCGSKDAYQIANGWKIFTNIVVLGDANGDGDVNQGDISLVKDYIMTGVEPQGFKWYGADADENDEIDVADIVMIVNLIKSMVK